MKAVVTGANGTLGKKLVAHLKSQGWDVVPWNRRAVPACDWHESELFLRRVDPDVVFHLAIASQPTGIQDEGWRINHDWPAQIAELCKQQQRTMIFTSTAMVFSDDAKGPFTEASQPDAASGYGFEKRMAEEAIRRINGDVRIARLGWQIDTQPGGNNMVEHLSNQFAEQGQISASKRWYPACSMLTDTAKALTALVDKPAGTYMLDSNREWTFYEIARALSSNFGFGWKVEANEDFVFDQRLQDQRICLPALSERLPALTSGI